MNSLLKLLGSTSFAQLLVIVASPILTRIYSPSDFGAFLILSSWVYILNSIAIVRMDVAIPVQETLQDIKVCFSVGFLANIFLCILSFVVILVLKITLDIEGFYFYIPLMVNFLALYQLIISLFLREGDVGFVAGNKIRQSIFLIVGQITIGYLSASVGSLAVSQAISFLITNIFSFKKWRNYFVLINPIHFFKKYKRFFVFDTLSNLFQVLANNLPQILISYLLGGIVGGLYYMAYRIIIMPVSIFSLSINQTISVDYNKYFGRQEKWNERSNHMIRMMVVIFLIPFMVLAAYVEKIFPVVFGHQWADAGVLIRFFSVWVFLRLIYDSFVINFSFKGMSETKFYIDLFMFIVKLVSILLFWKLNYTPMNVLELFSYVNVFSYVVALFVLFFRSGFNYILNMVLLILSSIFICIYPYFENLYITSILLFLFFYFCFWGYVNRRIVM